jgi:hypothetical protein
VRESPKQISHEKMHGAPVHFAKLPFSAYFFPFANIFLYKQKYLGGIPK